MNRKTQAKKTYKMILLGDYGVGKSSLVNRFHGRDRLSTDSTIGCAFSSVKHYFNDNGDFFNINIWDTAGQERYRSITQIYYNGIDIALIVYDLTELDSLEQIRDYWLPDLCGSRYFRDREINQLLIYLVGNKSDLYYRGNGPSKITEDKRKKIIADIKEKYPKVKSFLVSALTGFNIDNLVCNIAGKMEDTLTDDERVIGLLEERNPEFHLGPLDMKDGRRNWCC